MNYFLLVTKYDFCLIFTFLFRCLFFILLRSKKVYKYKVVLKPRSVVSRLVRMCLAQPGHGSGLLPSIHYRPNNCFNKFYFRSTFTFPSTLLLYLSKILDLLNTGFVYLEAIGLSWVGKWE